MIEVIITKKYETCQFIFSLVLNISLNNVLNDNDTLQLIIDRFNDGLRFWNIQNCNNDNIDIGQLFVYDNVEKSLI